MDHDESRHAFIPQCGDEYHPELVDDEPVKCPQCGYGRRFLRQPLFQVTGASGTGKTRVAVELPQLLPHCVVLDQDVLWQGAESEEEVRTYRRSWLELAAAVGQSGHPVVLCGTTLPQHIESLPERGWFYEIHYLALVCDPEKLADRLGTRPAWRHWDGATIPPMLAFNDWVRENSAQTHPPMKLLDTTEVSPQETVVMVAEWVRSHLRQRPPSRIDSST